MRHFHSILLDGVFIVGEEEKPDFHPLPELDTSDVADLMQVIRVRILGYPVRMGVIDDACDLNLLADRLAEREPALAQLAASAVSGLVPAGPELRQREPRAMTRTTTADPSAPQLIAVLSTLGGAFEARCACGARMKLRALVVWAAGEGPARQTCICHPVGSLLDPEITHANGRVRGA